MCAPISTVKPLLGPCAINHDKNDDKNMIDNLLGLFTCHYIDRYDPENMSQNMQIVGCLRN